MLYVSDVLLSVMLGAHKMLTVLPGVTQGAVCYVTLDSVCYIVSDTWSRHLHVQLVPGTSCCLVDVLHVLISSYIT